MSMKFDDKKKYMMPVGMWNQPYGIVGSHYDYNTRYSVTFVTDAEKLAKLLPPGFEPDEIPAITVNYAMCRGIDYLAGGGYNLIDVDAAVRFNGKRDQVRGSYGLVIWMNEFHPILLGREVLGAAKLYADVPDISMHPDGSFSFYGSERGAYLVEGKVWDLIEQTPEEIAAKEKAGEGTCWLGYKYIPSLNELSEPDVSYATWLPTATTIKQAWKGKGRVNFNDIPWEKAPVGGLVSSMLNELPVIEYLDSWVQIDSCVYEENRILL